MPMRPVPEMGSSQSEPLSTEWSKRLDSSLLAFVALDDSRVP